MIPNNDPSCKVCGQLIPADADTFDLCPSCLLSRVIESSAQDARKLDGRDWEAPAVEDLDRLFDGFEVIELIGMGGMGVVYKARQTSLDRFVAIKVFPSYASQDPSMALRFEREAKVLASLSHHNIVAIHEFGKVGAYFYFAMEWVNGVTLRRFTHTHTVSAELAVSLTAQVCDALILAHERGVVHRDIKPENILIQRLDDDDPLDLDQRTSGQDPDSVGGQIKLVDFGLAQLLQRQAGQITLTGAKHILGTPHYMAPEQFDLERDVDHRCDIYGLGVVMYELLTRKLPMGRFPAPSQVADVPVELDRIVMKCLAMDAKDRYDNARALKLDLLDVYSVASSRVTPVENLPPNGPKQLAKLSAEQAAGQATGQANGRATAKLGGKPSAHFWIIGVAALLLVSFLFYVAIWGFPSGNRHPSFFDKLTESIEPFDDQANTGQTGEDQTTAGLPAKNPGGSATDVTPNSNNHGTSDSGTTQSSTGKTDSADSADTGDSGVGPDPTDPSDPAHPDYPVPKPTDFPGLLMYVHEAIPKQYDPEHAYIPLEQIGNYYRPPQVVTSLSKWKYKKGDTAVVSGFLRITKPGIYFFRSVNQDGQSVLYIGRQMLIKFGNGQPRQKQILISSKGWSTITSIGYPYTNFVDVQWKQPGESEWSPIPAEVFYHKKPKAKSKGLENRIPAIN